jgi:osmotically-inducible protein OsmY
MVVMQKVDVEPQDRELEQRVTEYLQGLHRLPLRNIAVAANHGTVTLRGTLPSFYEKQLCLGCLPQVDGVSRLVDRIEVRYEAETRCLEEAAPRLPKLRCRKASTK